jgi:hypothetical protein
MGGTRLSTVLPDLDSVLSAARPECALKAAWAAAQWAIQAAGLSHPAVSAAKPGGSMDAVATLVAELDDQYLNLQDSYDDGEGSHDEALTAFVRARAASALAYAIRGEAAEAVYEAAQCRDDISGLRDAVTLVLG